MKSRTITNGLFLIVILLFLTVYLVINKVNNDMLESVEKIQAHVQNENWKLVDNDFAKVMTKWKTYRYIIALNYAEQEFNTLDDDYANLKGAIKAKDKETVIENINRIIYHQKNFKQLIPLP